MRPCTLEVHPIKASNTVAFGWFGLDMFSATLCPHPDSCLHYSRAAFAGPNEPFLRGTVPASPESLHVSRWSRIFFAPSSSPAVTYVSSRRSYSRSDGGLDRRWASTWDTDSARL